MTDTRRQSPLPEAITQLESAAFRAGQIARQLLADHPELTVRSVAASVYCYVDTYTESDSQGKPKLDLRASGVDGVRAWAQVLDAEVQLRVMEPSTGVVYEHACCTAEVGGVLVEVTGTRRLLDDEAAAWRAEQDRTAEGGEG